MANAVYDAKIRFGGECNPSKQLVILLDKVERIEKILDEAFKVKAKMSVEERMQKARESRKKNADN